MCLRGDTFLKEFRLGTWLLTIERRTFGLGSSAICETGGTGRIHLRTNLGSLSPMDGQTRTESFRLGRYWRDRCNNEETSVRYRSDVSNNAHSSGHHRTGGSYSCRYDAWPILHWRRVR